MSPRRRAPGRRRRGGYVLVLFAMMAIGLFGLAAVVIDLGLARATQAQMQSAVDAAALEGLRFRDDQGFAPIDSMLTGTPLPARLDPEERDIERRSRASLLVAARFDDDLDPSNGDDLELGAGPVVALTGGLAGDLNASALLTVDPANRVYDPVLQLNDLENLVHGDLVAGDWIADEPGWTPDPSLELRHEDRDYIRDDFTAAPSTADASATAFLARLRRTPASALDEDAGVSSHGPSLPFLFALGSTLREDDDPATLPYAPRIEGIKARATAIADGRVVLAVGQPDPVAGPVEVRFGVTPFSVDRNWWLSIADGTTLTLNVVPLGGRMALEDPSASVAQIGTITVTIGAGLASVGDAAVTTLDPGDLRVRDQVLRGEGYVPITDAGVVVGFGWVSILEAGQDLATLTQLQLTKRASRIAPENATAVAGPELTPRLAAALALPRRLLTTAEGALLAPALVR